jgi:hypothetical protein
MMRARLVLAVVLLLMTGEIALAGKSSSGVGGSHSFGGKGFSSGGSHSTGGKSYSSGGAHSVKSYSSGGAQSSSGSHSYTAGKPSSGSTGFTGSRPSSPIGSAGSRSPSKPSGSGSAKAGESYDSAASAAARRAESKNAYRNPSGRDYGASSVKTPRGKSYSSPNYSSNAPTYSPGDRPRSTYSDDRGRSRPLNPNDVRVGQIRNEMNSDRYYSRTTRSRNVFVNVYPVSGYPSVYYSDPYSNMFWWWLLGNHYSYGPSWGYPGYSVLDLWTYHHYNVMDRLRYQELLDHNAGLEARLRALEQRGIPRDPTWSPPGMDSDLMYTDEYVDAAVNPTQPAPRSSGSTRHLGRLFLEALIVIGLFALFVWLVFFKRWGGTNSPLGNRI